jgi:hypothetical protein
MTPLACRTGVRPGVRTLPLLLASVLLGSCADLPTRPDGRDATLHVRANVAGTQIGTLVLTVTAMDIPSPLVFNVTVVEGIASDTVRVPPGNARTFSIAALDAIGVATHEGSATADVVHGINPPLAITLVSRVGQIPITVAIGTGSVVLTPATATLDVGEQLQLAATILDGEGRPIAGAMASWATSHPGRARVDHTGRVTALTAGEVQIMAAYGGVGAVATLTVREADPLGPAPARPLP